MTSRQTFQLIPTVSIAGLKAHALTLWLPVALIILVCSTPLIGCKQKSSGPAFNVPTLLGKKIDAVQADLKLEPVATPAKLQPPATTGEVHRTFKKDDWYLVVSYQSDTGKVVNFVLGTEEDGGTLKEKERFLQAGTLREGDPLYTIDFIEASDTVFAYSGVRITPQPIIHKVAFRLTGSEDVFYVTYDIRPLSGPAKANKFVTVPPWEETFTAATRTKLTLEATPSSQAVRRSTTAPMQATVQILIDGKVAQQSKMVGLWAKCEMEIEY